MLAEIGTLILTSISVKVREFAFKSIFISLLLNEILFVAIECSLPRFVPHATMSGEVKFNHTMRVECEPGYFFRIAVNYIDVTCQADGTWSDDVSNMECVRKYRVEKCFLRIISHFSTNLEN